MNAPEYDRLLIAEMLEAYEAHTHCDTDLAHLESSIRHQARLLREADDEDAAGVHTVASGVHTPGPWFVDSESEHECGDTLLVSMNVIPDGNWRGTVCSLQSAGHIQGISRSEARANGRLISAAPELLAALIAMNEGFEDVNCEEKHCANCRMFANTRAVIAKATGGQP